ncbi:hypothetical protein CI610_01058 [invertebrate metagenome]|uniref:Protein kinase domain-containing protein n=1 Tax=invertebrate metagenome TaxID=1711999 RepID=A0A2H9T9M8_9ZZZZ
MPEGIPPKLNIVVPENHEPVKQENSEQEDDRLGIRSHSSVRHLPEDSPKVPVGKSLHSRRVTYAPSDGTFSPKTLLQKNSELSRALCRVKTQHQLVESLPSLIVAAQGAVEDKVLPFNVFYVTRRRNPQTGQIEKQRIRLIPPESQSDKLPASQSKRIHKALGKSLEKYQADNPVEKIQAEIADITQKLVVIEKALQQISDYEAMLARKQRELAVVGEPIKIGSGLKPVSVDSAMQPSVDEKTRPYFEASYQSPERSPESVFSPEPEWPSDRVPERGKNVFPDEQSISWNSSQGTPEKSGVVSISPEQAITDGESFTPRRTGAENRSMSASSDISEREEVSLGQATSKTPETGIPDSSLSDGQYSPGFDSRSMESVQQDVSQKESREEWPKTLQNIYTQRLTGADALADLQQNGEKKEHWSWQWFPSIYRETINGFETSDARRGCAFKNVNELMQYYQTPVLRDGFLELAGIAVNCPMNSSLDEQYLLESLMLCHRAATESHDADTTALISTLIEQQSKKLPVNFDQALFDVDEWLIGQGFEVDDEMQDVQISSGRSVARSPLPEEKEQNVSETVQPVSKPASETVEKSDEKLTEPPEFNRINKGENAVFSQVLMETPAGEKKWVYLLNSLPFSAMKDLGLSDQQLLSVRSNKKKTVNAAYLKKLDETYALFGLKRNPDTPKLKDEIDVCFFGAGSKGKVKLALLPSGEKGQQPKLIVAKKVRQPFNEQTDAAILKELAIQNRIPEGIAPHAYGISRTTKKRGKQPQHIVFMDIVPGASGGALAHQVLHRFSGREKKEFLHALLTTIDRLHKNSVYHGDLGWRNISYDKATQSLHVIDLGEGQTQKVAPTWFNNTVLRCDLAPELTATEADLTDETNELHSVDYEKVDAYALGYLLLEVFCGADAASRFEKASWDSNPDNRGAQQIRALEGLKFPVDKMRQVVSKMLSVNPGQRYAPERAIHQLEAYFEELGTESSEETETDKEMPSSKDTQRKEASEISEVFSNPPREESAAQLDQGSLDFLQILSTELKGDHQKESFLRRSPYFLSRGADGVVLKLGLKGGGFIVGKMPMSGKLAKLIGRDRHVETWRSERNAKTSRGVHYKFGELIQPVNIPNSIKLDISFTPFIEGDVFGRILDSSKKAWAPPEIKQLGQGLLSEFRNLWSMDIGHTDAHSGNIIITPEGTPRLLDFGRTKSLSDEGVAKADFMAIFHHLLTTALGNPDIYSTRSGEKKKRPMSYLLPGQYLAHLRENPVIIDFLNNRIQDELTELRTLLNWMLRRIDHADKSMLVDLQRHSYFSES